MNCFMWSSEKALPSARITRRLAFIFDFNTIHCLCSRDLRWKYRDIQMKRRHNEIWPKLYWFILIRSAWKQRHSPQKKKWKKGRESIKSRNFPPDIIFSVWIMRSIFDLTLWNSLMYFLEDQVTQSHCGYLRQCTFRVNMSKRAW